MERSINYTQKLEIITMNITGESVVKELDVCMTRKKAVAKSLSILIGIEVHDMEIARPKQIKKGISLTIYVYANDKNIDFKKILKEASGDNGELGEVFKSGWDLSKAPVISDINTVIIESKKMRKDSRFNTEEQMATNIDTEQTDNTGAVEMMEGN